MNIVSKVTLEGIKRSRTRTAVTIIGVVLCVALITSVTTFIASLQNFLMQSAIAHSGDWHVEFIDVDADFVRSRANDKELSRAAVTQNVGYAELKEGKNEYKPYLFVMGLSDEAFDDLSVNLTSGRLPQNDGEVIVPEHLSANGGVTYALGDELTLQLGRRIMDGRELGRRDAYEGPHKNAVESAGSESENAARETLLIETTRTYKVVGICKRPGFEDYSFVGYTLMTRMDKQAMAPPATNQATSGSQSASASGSFDVFATLLSPSETYGYAERMAGDRAYSVNSDYMIALGVSNNTNFTFQIYSLGAILACLIMIGSILLIYNSFAISVSERSRQFGILSSVGATSGQLRRSVLFEGACIGLAGIPLGLLLGIGGIGVTLKLIGGIFADMTQGGVPMTLDVSAPAVLIAAAVGVATILISAYIPARRAAGRSAMASIRRIEDIRMDGKASRKTPNKDRNSKSALLTRRLFGIEGTLALKNFHRDRKRYRSTVVSLFLSVVLFISASAFSLYLKQATEMSIEDYGFDIMLSSMDETLIDVYDELKGADAVTGSVYQAGYNYLYALPKDMFSERYRELQNMDSAQGKEYLAGVTVAFVEDEAYDDFLNDLGPGADELLRGSKFPAIASVKRYDSEERRYVSFGMFDAAAVALRIEVPDPDELEPSARRAKGIDVAIVDEMPAGMLEASAEGFIVFAPFSRLGEFPASPESYEGITMTFLSDDPAKSGAEMLAIMDDAGWQGSYNFFNVAESMKQSRNILLVVDVFTYGFVILISLIAVANVFNTVSTNVSLRRREFAMLRSVGMTDGGIDRMMNFECVVYGLKALMGGIPVSIVITCLIYRAMFISAEVAFTLPWAGIAVSVASVFLVVFVTMLYSVRKVRKINIIEALREDMA